MASTRRAAAAGGHLTGIVNGLYAYRAVDGAWYVMRRSTGTYTGRWFADRLAAVRYMAAANTPDSTQDSIHPRGRMQ